MKYIFFSFLLLGTTFSHYITATDSQMFAKVFFRLEDCMCEKIEELDQRAEAVQEELKEQIAREEISFEESSEKMKDLQNQCIEEYFQAIQKKIEFDQARDTIAKVIGEEFSLLAVVRRSSQQELDDLLRKLEIDRAHCRKKYQEQQKR